MTKVEKLIQLLAGILDHFAREPEIENVKFIKVIQDKFGFQTEFGWNILLNAIYIFQDTELAKSAFRKFLLQGPGHEVDISERYLRLYGILNAYYLQKDAAINLVEIFKIPNKTQIKDNFEKLKIVELRNKVAHSASYNRNPRKKQKEKNEVFVYELHRHKLSVDEIILCKNQEDLEKYDLTNSMDEFDSYLYKILVEISKKLIKKVFNNTGEFQDQVDIIISDNESD